ncbi:MAG TPA: Gfo/Idh/MocA family oxidoreductase, partial [Puia sp.]|nr:Gfo/Idh/MocA family oxidoreductase [Puia sp.]
MYKALVIGCGNIGALYDFNNGEIQTHVKALHLNPRFSLSIFDNDKDLAKKISRKYACETVEMLDDETLQSFDCISICTPTRTHAGFILKAMKS